jgi:metal-responsive CopG/Arc/MetJ family transcriptional regulator
MKTAISLEAHLLEEADRTARSMGLSRSRLVSLALRDYLRHRRQEQIVEQLNQVYSDHPDPTDTRIVQGIKRAFHRTIKDRW